MFHQKNPKNKSPFLAGLQQWLILPVYTDAEQAFSVELINGTLLTVIVVWLVGMLLQILLVKIVSWANVQVALISIAGLLVLREGLRRGYLRVVSHLVLILGFISTTVMIWNRGSILTLQVFGYLLVIALATLLFGKLAGGLYATLVIVAVWVQAQFEINAAQTGSRAMEPLDLNNQAFVFIFIALFTFGIINALKIVIKHALYKARFEISQRVEAENALRALNASLDQRVSERTRELEAVIEKQHLAELTLRSRNESFSILHRSTLAFLRYRDIDELLQSLVDHAVEMLDSPFAEIVTLEGDELVVRAFSANQPYLAGDRSNRGTALLTWQAVDTREPAVLEDYSVWPLRRSLFEPANLHAAAELPILVGDGQTVLGVLGLARIQPNYPYSPDEIEMGRLFTQIAGLAIENIQLQSSLKEQSLRDPLTGLHNRRYLFETLQLEIARAQRGAYTICFVLLDIDHFKALNDQYGHGTGDAMLRALAERLKTLVRAGDILCRYGGDEHIIIMSNTTSEVAMERTEQLRLAVEALLIEYEEQTLHCTISIGIATYPTHGSSVDEVISKADQALYISKNSGRNRTTLYHEQ
jgi:diguanylate cyclase (GGDEF)-like protein